MHSLLPNMSIECNLLVQMEGHAKTFLVSMGVRVPHTTTMEPMHATAIRDLMDHIAKTIQVFAYNISSDVRCFAVWT